MRLDGKTALVTGAGVRVGKAIALALAGAGCDVAVHYRWSDEGAADTVARIHQLGRTAHAFRAELTDAPQAARLVERAVGAFGGVDILVNSAAVFVHQSFDGGIDEDWERAWRTSIDTNLIAPARLSRLCASHLSARAGCIINVLDVGAERAWPGYAHHTAAKAGLAHLTRTLAVALGPDVRVNGVSPGIAAFPDGMPDDEREALIRKTALKRPGCPEDIGEAAVFFAAQSYTTGAILHVDGGWHVPR